MAGPDHRLLDHIRGVFGYRQPAHGRNDQRDSTGMTELEGGAGILVDEGLLDRRLMRHKGGDHRLESVLQLDKPLGERAAFVRAHHAVGNVAEPGAVALDDAPAGAPEPRIDADDAIACPMP